MIQKNGFVLVKVLPLLLLLGAVILTAYLLGTRTGFLNRASELKSPTLIDEGFRFGPGELTDILATSSATYNWYPYPEFITTFHVSGSRTQNYASLSGEFKYHEMIANFPQEKTISFPFSRTSGGFIGNVKLPYHGCLDIKTSPQEGKLYLGSFCVQNNIVGYTQEGSLGGPNTAHPYKYVSGQGYIGGQSNYQTSTYYYFDKFVPNVENNKFAVQALTMVFDKTKDPYYNPVDQRNFIPTNTYWSLQSNLDPASIRETRYDQRPTAFVDCTNSSSKLVAFNKTSDLAPARLLDASNMYPPTSPECWFTTYFYTEPFFNKQFVTLKKSQEASPSATPTLTATPSAIPTPTPSPTPIASPSASPTIPPTGDLFSVNIIASPNKGKGPLTVKFSALTPIVPAIKYQWNFGDNSAGSTSKKPKHVYAYRKEPYKVVLKATSPEGIVKRVTTTVTVTKK